MQARQGQARRWRLGRSGARAAGMVALVCAVAFAGCRAPVRERVRRLEPIRHEDPTLLGWVEEGSRRAERWLDTFDGWVSETID